MGNSRSKYAALAIFILALGSSTAMGREIKGSGTITFHLSQLAQIPLAGGKFLTERRATGVGISADPTSPYHLASQDCVGASVGDAKGGPEEDNGFCVIFDKSGDAYWISYSIKGDDGKWAVTSGTGKFAGMTGDGATKTLALTPDGRMTMSWIGTLNVK